MSIARSRDNRFTKETMKKLVFSIGMILLLIGGGWVVHNYEYFIRVQSEESAIKQLVVEGDKALNIGRYTDAKRVFSEELKINPQNKQAAWGLKKAQVWDMTSATEFKQAVDTLYQQNPNDGHVNLFLGEYYAANHEPDKAQSYYEAAIQLEPRLAEAHYALAVLNEQQGNLNAARVEFLKAISLSPESKYHNSLATNYFKQQLYELAIKEYGKNLQYPLSSLESAKIFWRLGYLSQALDYQRQAIEYLENETIMNKPENQDAWYLESTPGQSVRLGTIEEKKSYGYLSLSATLYLQGYPEAAEKEVQKVRDFKLPRQTEINALIKNDLDTLLQGNAEVLEMVKAFKELYL